MTPAEDLRDAIQAKAREIAKRSTSGVIDGWAAEIVTLAEGIPALPPVVLERRGDHDRRERDMPYGGGGRRIGQRRGAVQRYATDAATCPVTRVHITSVAPANFEPPGTHQLTVVVFGVIRNKVTGNLEEIELTGRTVTFESSDPSKVSVNGSGLVTAVAAGSATVTPKCEGVLGQQADGTRGVTYTVTTPIAAVDSVVVSPASATIAEGSSKQFQASVRDAGNNVLLGKSVTWSEVSGPSLINTGPDSGDENHTCTVEGVAEGSASIKASCEGIDSAPVNITIIVPGDLTWDNEPAGLTPIIQSRWDEAGAFWQTIGNAMWWTGNQVVRTDNANIEVVTIDDHPIAGITKALRIRTPAGTPAGYGPWAYQSRSTSSQMWGSGFRELYCGFYSKLASDFYGQGSGSNKHFWFREDSPAGPQAFWIIPWGSGYDPNFDLRLDASAGISLGNHTVATIPNQFTPGAWHKWEMWVRKGATRGATTHWKVWRDGVLVFDKSDVVSYGYTDDLARLYAVSFHGTWGGAGGPNLHQDNYQWFSPFYVSGKTT